MFLVIEVIPIVVNLSTPPPSRSFILEDANPEQMTTIREHWTKSWGRHHVRHDNVFWTHLT